MNEWIKCSDRIPQDMLDVIFTDGDGIYKGYLFYGYDEKFWMSQGDFTIYNVTHWMPLPPLPKG